MWGGSRDAGESSGEVAWGCDRSGGIWGWLWFSCGMGNCGKGFATVFWGFSGLVLAECWFRLGGGWALGYHFTTFISNTRALFDLWWKKNLLKHQRVSKYKNNCSMQNSTCAYEIDTKMTKKSIKINILLMTRRADNRKMKINFEVRNWVLISIQ